MDFGVAGLAHDARRLRGLLTVLADEQHRARLILRDLADFRLKLRELEMAGGGQMPERVVGRGPQIDDDGVAAVDELGRLGGRQAAAAATAP